MHEKVILASFLTLINRGSVTESLQHHLSYYLMCRMSNLMS